MEKAKRKRKVWKIVLAIVAIVVVIVIGFQIFIKIQMAKIPGMSSQDVLMEMTRGNDEAAITIATIKDGKVDWHVWGKDNKELEKQKHIYEIGSVSKTFVGAMTAKAIREGKLSLEEEIGDTLFPGEYDSGMTPTVLELVTHSSGFKSYYINSTILSRTFTKNNAFKDISKEMMLEEAKKHMPNKKEYGFSYSNFGISILGLLLEKKYDTPFHELLTSYIQDDLQLENVKIQDASGDFPNYWDWNLEDGYLPAGAIISDIDGMIAYAKMNIEESNEDLVMAHKELKEYGVPVKQAESVGMHMNALAMTWVIDKKNNTLWHNGATDHFKSYLAFNKEENCAVIVLSNVDGPNKVFTSILGVKLMEELLGKNTVE